MPRIRPMCASWLSAWGWVQSDGSPFVPSQAASRPGAARRIIDVRFWPIADIGGGGDKEDLSGVWEGPAPWPCHLIIGG